MKVLMVTNCRPSEGRPGAGAFIEQQVLGLSKEGVDASWAYADRLRLGYRAYLGIGATVMKAAELCRADLVHCLYGGVMAYQVVTARSNVPVVVSFCGSDLLGENFRELGRWAASRIGVVCSKIAARRADGVIVKSRNLGLALPANLNQGRLAVIPNGVDLDKFRPMDQKQCRRSLGWGDEIEVLFPRNEGSPVKRVWLAEQALELLRRKGMRVNLRRLSNVPHAEVPIWLNGSDCLLLTSLHEGSPNIVKEALACNTPVVSVPVGDVAERLSGIDGCELVSDEPESVASGLIKVLTKGGRARGGRERVSALAIEVVSRRIIRFYSEVLKDRAALA